MRIKVAFFISNFGVGGAERQYWYLINSINRDLFDVYVVQISHKNSRPSPSVHNNVRISTFEMKSKFDIGVLLRISNHIRKNGIELIQSQLFMDNQIARAVGFISRKPVVTSVRGGPTLGKMRTRIEHGIQWLSHSVVVNSGWLKNILIADGVRAEKIHIIHNGINPLKFKTSKSKESIKADHNIPVKSPVIGIIARLHPMKDHHTFFDVVKLVMNDFPDLKAIVAGDGELRSELMAYVEQLEISNNVMFLGSVGEELPEILSMLDVILLTSRWGESLPNVLLEAMSAGVPIVATNIHGIPEVVDDGINGYLANRGDSHYMARKVVDLLKDDSLRKKLIENGDKKIEEFTIPAMVKKYEQLYLNIIEDYNGTQI